MAKQNPLYQWPERNNSVSYRKMEKEKHYKLKKELWGFRNNRIAVRFEYEYENDQGKWFRAYGNEMWEFNEQGLMRKRYASINDIEINKNDRYI